MIVSVRHVIRLTSRDVKDSRVPYFVLFIFNIFSFRMLHNYDFYDLMHTNSHAPYTSDSLLVVTYLY